MEGPSLVILQEELEPFLDEKVLKVWGNSKQPKEELLGRQLSIVDTWGKNLFLIFTSTKEDSRPLIIKVHFLLFGSYRINEPKDGRDPRLAIGFKAGTIYLYSCSILFNAEDYLNKLDRAVDLLSPDWDLDHVLHLMSKKKNSYLCDLFLDQEVFAGSGNIVKNEVLFNLRTHPLTRLSDIEKDDWPLLAEAVRDYCFNFYEWKKKYELKRHWQVYRKSLCPVCGRKLVRSKLGKLGRMNFTCLHCQELREGRPLEFFPVLPLAGDLGPREVIDH